MVPLSSTRLVVQKRAAISDVIYDITGIVISILRSSWTIPPIKYWSLLCGKFKDIHFNMECTTLWKDTRSHYICAGVAIALLIRCIDYDNIKLLGHWHSDKMMTCIYTSAHILLEPFSSISIGNEDYSQIPASEELDGWKNWCPHNYALSVWGGS